MKLQFGFSKTWSPSIFHLKCKLNIEIFNLKYNLLNGSKLLNRSCFEPTFCTYSVKKELLFCPRCQSCNCIHQLYRQMLLFWVGAGSFCILPSLVKIFKKTPQKMAAQVESASVAPKALVNGPLVGVQYPNKVLYCGGLWWVKSLFQANILIYCPFSECSMPFEYCEYYSNSAKCKEWLEKNLPDMFSQLYTNGNLFSPDNCIWLTFVSFVQLTSPHVQSRRIRLMEKVVMMKRRKVVKNVAARHCSSRRRRRAARGSLSWHVQIEARRNT